MKLLLHACCGPCSIEPVRILEEDGHEVTLAYLNSNIEPKEEYDHRLNTLTAWAHVIEVPVEEGPYDCVKWEQTVGKIGEAGLQDAQKRLKEAGNENPSEFETALEVDPRFIKTRCRMCYRMRFEEAAARAVAEGFDGISTTLSVSPFQFTEIIEEELKRAAQAQGLAYVFRDYRDFFDEATRKSIELGMYRQNYCGCRFSRTEADAQRDERKRKRKAEKEAKRKAEAPLRAAQAQEQRERAAKRDAYNKKQAYKHAVLKQLREEQREKSHNLPST
ncbi:MAG: epoxyqueuosine reductase QueH [Eggerthellaceae bacterium]|jgi:predicted adenine nucleotide alpha hydrolase (AANH) superfamily ATPase